MLLLCDSDVITVVGSILLDRTMQQLYPLCFDRTGYGYDVSAASGALVRSTAPTDGRLALCTDPFFPNSRSAAAFTVVSKGRWACYIGLARCTADVEQSDSVNSSDFFGLGSGSGKLCHNGRCTGWEGAEGFHCGDRVELLYDGVLGTLCVAINCRVLGRVHLQQLGQSAAGACLCWAVSASDIGWAVRVEQADLAVFGASGPGAANQSDDEDDIC